jgi:hypothetical protein
VSVEVAHIHIGPGPLGLGLPVAVSTSLDNAQTHVVGKPGLAHPPYFQRTVYARDGSHKSESVPVASFSCPEGASVGPQLARGVADAELVLITVAVRDGIAQRAQLIDSIIEQCPHDRAVAFVACENTLTDAHRKVIGGLAPRVQRVRSIVDRVCTWPDLATAPPHPRHVVYHEVGEWILEAPNPKSTLARAIGEASDVCLVDDRHFAAYGDRKTWLVNGLHLDAALRGRARNQPELWRVIAEPEVLTAIQEIIDVMQGAYTRRHGMRVESPWALDRLRVVCQLPDSADRVLKSLRRVNPVGFIEGFERRIAVPARIAASSRALPPCLDELAEDLTDVLCDLEQYTDWSELRPGQLTPGQDAATVKALERALIGWTRRGLVDREVARLADALRRHRRKCG